MADNRRRDDRVHHITCVGTASVDVKNHPPPPPAPPRKNNKRDEEEAQDREAAKHGVLRPPKPEDPNEDKKHIPFWPVASLGNPAWLSSDVVTAKWQTKMGHDKGEKVNCA